MAAGAGRRAASSLFLWAPALLLLVSCGASSAPQALWTAASDVYLVREGEVVSEDVYAAAYLVKIEGVIEGDLVVLASDRLEVTGRVEGDLTGFAAAASVEGEVEGSVRLAGVDIEAAGRVGKDAVMLGREVGLGGAVAGDALVWAGRLSAGGEVGRDLKGAVLGPAVLSGAVGRDAELAAGRMRLLSGARVGGDLAYRSGGEAALHPGASVGGAVFHRRPAGPQFIMRAAGLMAASIAFLLFLGSGLLWIRFRTEKAERCAAYLERHPLKCLLRGLALLSAPAALAGALMSALWRGPPGWVLITAAVLLVLGPALALALGYIAFICPLPVLIAAGRRMSRGRLDLYGGFLVSALLLGALLFVLEALTPIPYAGPAVIAAAVLLGSGISGKQTPPEQAE